MCNTGIFLIAVTAIVVQNEGVLLQVETSIRERQPTLPSACNILSSLVQTSNILQVGTRGYLLISFLDRYCKLLKFTVLLVSELLRLLEKPGRIAQSVGHLTRKSGVPGSIPGLATYFRFSFRFFKKGSCQLLAKVCAQSTG